MIRKVITRAISRLLHLKIIRDEIINAIQEGNYLEKAESLSKHIEKDKLGNLQIHSSAIINDIQGIHLRDGKIFIGEGSRIGDGVKLDTANGSILIGKFVVINDYSVIYGNGGVFIGDFSMIATHCVIIPSNHIFNRLDLPVQGQGQTKKGINIGKGVWIGANVTVLDGVEIGNGSIIGAGSVVTKSIPPNKIAFGNPARIVRDRLHEDLIDLTIISQLLIDYVYDIQISEHRELVDRILKYNSSDVNFVAEDERAFPGNKEYFESGYYNIMLKRYFFSGSFLCRGKSVLDSCSGLGWGTYILAQYAKNIIAFDIEEQAILFSKSTWDSDNIEWLLGNALNTSFLNGNQFDVVTAFETIEHFTKKDGEEYIRQMSLVLKDDGFLIGTSAFPATQEEAAKLCATNQYHLYIFTENEMTELLKKYFKEHVIINKWMFIARK